MWCDVYNVRSCAIMCFELLQMDAGQLVCGGATGSPPDGALFIFKDATQQEIEHYVKVGHCNGFSTLLLTPWFVFNTVCHAHAG